MACSAFMKSSPRHRFDPSRTLQPPNQASGSARACSVADGAKYLGVSEPTLWRMLRDGQLAKVSLRNRTLVRYADLDALLEASR